MEYLNVQISLVWFLESILEDTFLSRSARMRLVLQQNKCIIILWNSKKKADQIQYSERLVSSCQLNAHFLNIITIYMLHYNPQHVSNSILLIFRRTNCIITASGIVTLCKRPYSELHSALNRQFVRPFAESDDIRGCNNTICPLEDEQGTARNILRIIM